MQVGLSGEKQKFELVSGFTITQEFNETLDSATIIFRADHRLNIKPYDECAFDNGLVMLVDNFVETQESLEQQRFLYTVNLMSLTKLLEKIQLPNKAITHSLVSGQKEIITFINEFLTLYTPKIKMLAGETWEYKPLFVNKLDSEKYSVKCRDLIFSKPTLRQALTTLMLQVGCIPILVKNTETNEIELRDLDFRAKGNNITTLDQYCNFITRSNASDSYVNILKTANENVLDDENVVISELLGFRDSANVFIKQKENLILRTRFPIYDVKKLEMFLVGESVLTVQSKSPFVSDNVYLVLGSENSFVLGYISQYNNLFDLYNNVSIKGTIYIYELEVKENQSEEDVFFIKRFYSKQNINKQITADDADLATNPFQLSGAAIFVGEITATRISDGVVVSGELVVSTQSLAAPITHPETLQIAYMNYPYVVDITKLCVENGKRNLLDTNFAAMQQVSSIEELAQYIYGTVGYKIGTNTIEGFSQTYSVAAAFLTNEITYIENIVKTILSFSTSNLPPILWQYNGEYYDRICEQQLGGVKTDRLSFNRFSFTNDNESLNFSSIVFNIEYKPLNNINATHTKNDIEVNIPLEQYDSSENSITNANNLIEVEQQKIDRFGNDVITINQRIPLSANNTGYNLNDRILGEYIIFKKETQYNPYDIQIVYTASKDYVLQNFFTAIQTKYRAYEYVDFGQSVLRQENKTIYCLIDRFFFDGDDHIVWGNTSSINFRLEGRLLSGALNEYDYNVRLISCGVGYEEDKNYTNDLSTIKYKNGIMFITQMYDGVSYGQELIPLSQEYESLGGYEQSWYIRENFTEFRFFLSNTNGINFVKEKITAAYKLPLMQDIEYYIDNYGEQFDNYNLILYVEDNKSNSKTKIFYLDQQEILNQTLQFEFYTTDSGIKWTEKLWELCNLVCDKPKGEKFIYVGLDEEFKINENGYTDIDISKLQTYSSEQIRTFSDVLIYGGSGIEINWSEIAAFVDFIKIVYKENDTYYDLLAVERLGNNESDKIYITLNDTKSLKVGTHRNNCLVFDEYEVAKNTLNRGVENL